MPRTMSRWDFKHRILDPVHIPVRAQHKRDYIMQMAEALECFGPPHLSHKGEMTPDRFSDLYRAVQASPHLSKNDKVMFSNIAMREKMLK
jgi:hypothetical protein